MSSTERKKKISTGSPSAFRERGVPKGGRGSNNTSYVPKKKGEKGRAPQYFSRKEKTNIYIQVERRKKGRTPCLPEAIEGEVDAMGWKSKHLLE